MATTYRKILQLETTEDYNAFKRSGFPRPNLVMVKDTGKVYINDVSKKDAMPGDVVCYDTNNNMVIVDRKSLDLIRQNGYSVEAVVVVPASHAGGNLVCMSIELLYDIQNATSFEDRNHNMSFNWSDGFYSNYVSVAARTENSTSATITCLHNGYLPVEYEAENSRLCADDNYTNYIVRNADVLCPSPYNATDGINSAYADPMKDRDEVTNVLGNDDVNPREAVVAIVEGSNRIPSNSAALNATMYSTDHIREWFLPSAHMLGYLVARYTSIMNTLRSLRDILAGTQGKACNEMVMKMDFTDNNDNKFLVFNGKTPAHVWTVTMYGYVSPASKADENEEPYTQYAIPFTIL